MTIAEKAILKADKVIDDAINKLEEERVEAQRDYWDTGYDRYYKKMHNREEQLEQLKEYIGARIESRRLRRRCNSYERAIETYMKQLDELGQDLRGDLPDNVINYVIGRAKTRLELSLEDAK